MGEIPKVTSFRAKSRLAATVLTVGALASASSGLYGECPKLLHPKTRTIYPSQIPRSVSPG